MNFILALAGFMTEDDSETVTVEDICIIDRVLASLSSLPVQAITFEDIKREVLKDQEMKDLVRAITNIEGHDRFPDTVSRYNNCSVLEMVSRCSEEELSSLDPSDREFWTVSTLPTSALLRCWTEPSTLYSGQG